MAFPHRLLLFFAAGAAISWGCSGAPIGTSPPCGPEDCSEGAVGTTGGGFIGSNGSDGGLSPFSTTGSAVQYCGLPDGGIPVPCDQLDGGSGGTGFPGDAGNGDGGPDGDGGPQLPDGGA